MLTIILFSLCFLVPIQKIAAQFLTDISSDYFTAHTFVHDKVEYILSPEYRVTWDEARVICLSYKAKLATMDTDRKARAAIRAIIDSDLPITDNLWIGAREDSPGSWYWISNGNQVILKNMPRRNVSLWYSNSPNENFQCLSIERVHHDVPIFIPLRCNQRRPFICERDGYKSNAESTQLVGSTRIDEEEFVLYSTRLTWPEAIAYCRKEGLQIAEVETTAQAQSLAFLMIRARPESIENAWIGGYATENVWKWLPSGNSILNNGLWRDDNRKSQGCLLLDRHACELPVYLEAKCDRKRDVLCQRTSKKRMSEKPIPVYVEGCPYWIGLHELAWSRAQLSCKQLNASLVILDSPRILNHMMSLMEDNREELRHIWTDGRRKWTTFNDTMLRKWIWESTGGSVPEIEASFIPWCSAGQCHDDGANCLKLDRASYDTPIVYGLACNQRQTYVCQPWSGRCVPRRSDLNVSNARPDDDLPHSFLPPKTTTVFYYDEQVSRKSFHTTTPSFIDTHRTSSSKPTSQFDDVQKNLYFEEGISSMITNSSVYNNDIEKIAYAEDKKENISDSTATFSVPHYIFRGPIIVRITSKDAGNNIRGEFELKSSLNNNFTFPTSNDKISNKFKFRYLPINMFDAKRMLYNKLKMYPWLFRPPIYFLPSRYYYYPWYYVRSKNPITFNQKKIFLHR